ncbi:hypothetical protein ABPG75_009139 [Micractinium tetrahymenae]
MTVQRPIESCRRGPLCCSSPPPEPLAESPAPPPESPPLPLPPSHEWQLLWADEFDRADPLRPGSCWEAQLGDGTAYDCPCWGNNERRSYTARPGNVRIEDGQLVIEARWEDPPALPGQPYTSARIRTAGRFSVCPSPGSAASVRVEARLRCTPGPGLWPALWMLPETAAGAASGHGEYGSWAASGELDVMEMMNSMQQVIGSIHFGQRWPGIQCLSGHTYLTPEQAGQFHVFAVEWDRTQMRWFLDGQQYFEARSGGGSQGGGWWSGGPGAGANSPFDRPFHLLLNLALGSEASEFTTEGGVGITEAQLQVRERLADPAGNPAQLVVDWVRVYQSAEASPAAEAPSSG